MLLRVGSAGVPLGGDIHSTLEILKHVVNMDGWLAHKWGDGMSSVVFVSHLLGESNLGTVICFGDFAVVVISIHDECVLWALEDSHLVCHLGYL